MKFTDLNKANRLIDELREIKNFKTGVGNQKIIKKEYVLFKQFITFKEEIKISWEESNIILNKRIEKIEEELKQLGITDFEGV